MSIEVNPRHLASPFEKSQGKPAAPMGLESSGPNRNFFISKLHDWKLQSAVSAVLFVSAACGGGADANASSSSAKETQSPAAVVNLTSEVTATPKVEITTPEVTKAATVAPSDTAASNSPAKSVDVVADLPSDTQLILSDVKVLLDKVSFFPEASDVVLESFGRNWEKASTPRGQWSVYSKLYSTLRSCYISTCKPESKPQVLAQMTKIEETMAAKWPEFYKVSLNDPNAWLRESK